MKGNGKMLFRVQYSLQAISLEWKSTVIWYGQTSRLHVKNRPFDSKNWSEMMFFGSAGQNKGSTASSRIIPDPTHFYTFPPEKFFPSKKNIKNEPMYWGRDKIWPNPGYNQPLSWKFLLPTPLQALKSETKILGMKHPIQWYDMKTF